MHELMRILSIQVDYSGEHSHDALLKNEQMRSCLSIMISFGFKGDKQPRNFSSTYALTAVSIRSQAWNITIATSPHFQVGGKKSPLDDFGRISLIAYMLGASLLTRVYRGCGYTGDVRQVDVGFDRLVERLSVCTNE